MIALKPLVVFTGLATATTGAIVANTYYKNATKQSPPSAPEKVAAVTPPKSPELPAPKVKVPKADVPVAKTPESKSVPPSFDVVRVEPDGSAVIVGKAKPGADVSIRLNGKELGKVKANNKGDWVYLPVKPLPRGSHQLDLVTVPKVAGKPTLKSAKSVVIHLPKDKAKPPLVALSDNKGPTTVLQGQKKAAKVEKKAPEAMKKVAAAPPPKVEAPRVEAPKPVVKKSAPEKVAPKVVKKEAPAPKVVNKPEPEKVMKKVVEAAPKPAPKPAPKTPEKKVVQTAKLQPKPVTKTKPRAVEPPKSVVPKTLGQRLVFGTVDYDDKGKLVFSGKATPNKTVRLYVDNRPIGDARVDPKGQWVFSGKGSIKPGLHELRADQLDAKGRVTQRTAVPFMRARPEKVASLLNMRKAKEKPKAVAEAPKPQPVAPVVKKKTPAPKPAPVIAKKVPEPKPAPVIVKKAEAPKPVPVETKKAAAPKVVDVMKKPTAVAKAQEPMKDVKVAVMPPKKVEPKAPAVVAETPKVPPPAPVVAAKEPEKPASPPAGAKKPVDSPAAVAQVPHVLIQPGNNLWNISRVIYGKGVAYTTIYQANRDQIKNPDRIYPGQIFDTPGALSPGSIPPDRREPLANAKLPEATQ